MRDQFLNSAAAGVITAVAVVLVTQASAQSRTGLVTMLKTPWGEPDLEGIWTAEFESLCETCKYKNVDFLEFLRSGSKNIDDFANSRSERRPC